ncbi:6,7-dimethyl-8-ribityllumazine synthase [Parvularcula dongshanensis]|uniref:6,7-dimethyl-8-ribityllumazine synthase n=1 Tax=Parvularcula dongshanensis TaxID=1173995 RepID=A0A840I6G6_9PROT|nr:6,7-dimethyl-8-ribityllumazine synthase [Parvularcula dongshanensis]MBB4660042.1 6,7-dimethyl-8-ribityllumazine synthase [Parvularcula dongshanensis]
MKRIEASADGRGLRVCVVDTGWNEFIVERLTKGALGTLRKLGVAEDDVTHVTVAGAFELPIAAKTAAETGRFDAVVALGCVIRGSTPHFDYVAGEAAKGIAKVGLDTGVPVIFGVLTTDTVEQAMDRAGIKLGNKGAEAAAVAVETARTLAAIKEG